MADRGIYSVTFANPAEFRPQLVERELKAKCEEIVAAASGRQIGKVTYLVDWVGKIGLEREGWDTPPEAA
jgi:hypothetical protein